MKARSRAASSSTNRSTTSTSRRTRSLPGAASWLDRVGVAALLPGADLVLPSLWEAVAGTPEVEWGVRRDDGRHEFTPEMSKVWAWKDELPTKGLALVGKHFGRWQALVAPRMVPHVHAVAADRREELSQLQTELVAAVRDNGPCTGPRLRELVGAEKKHVDAAVVSLQRALVLTNAHRVPQPQGWDAIAVELVERLWKPGHVAEPERELARTVLSSSGELSAADLGGALGWRLKRAREALDALVERGEAARGEQGGVALYSPI